MAAASLPVPANAGVVQRFFDCALLGMVASGYFAVLGSGELDWPTAALTLAALCLRALAIANVMWFEIPPKTVAVLTLAYVLFYATDYFFLSRSFLTATVHMIFFVAVVKLLTAKTPRDHTYIKVIAALELLAAALLSTHISFFAFLAAFLLCTVATLASGEVLRSMRLLSAASGAGRSVSPAAMRGFPRRLAVLACALFCGILFMTAGMFFVLPRTARAAFQRLAPGRYHLPGFASEVKLGEIGVIKQNTAPVMHIASREGDGFLAVRWRGAALTRFDGQRWFNPPANPERLRVDKGLLTLPRVPHARPGRSIRYEVQLDDIASETLFFAGSPENVFIQTVFVLRSPYGSLSVPPMSVGGLRYSAYSFLEDETAEADQILPPLPETERAALLALPPLDRRIYDLAREWTTGAASAGDQARAIERRLRTEYGYSLELLSSPVADPLSYFLFTRRVGHCEYFASAMAVMLRTLGIPSRVVTGFLSGVYNPITERQVVRASDAHSWVEAWIPGRGWTTFDPTPPDPSASPEGLRTQLAMFFDAIDQFWHDWIVGYDFDHQVALASRVQAGGRRVRLPWIADAARWLRSSAEAGGGWLAALAAAGALGLLALFYGPAWWRWGRGQFRLHRARRGAAHPSDATLLYERMLALLEKRGFQKPPWLTPAEFARVLPASELALLVDDLTRAYNQVRFGGRRDAAPHMVRLLRRIETLFSSA
jgi:transglutaminase-like putative cysteine protease